MLSTDLMKLGPFWITYSWNYNEIRAVGRTFPRARILLCKWHVLAFLKKCMVKLFGMTREQAYRSFYECVYAHIEEELERLWTSTIAFEPEKMIEYIMEIWYYCRELLSLAFRRQYRLIGNNTNN